MLVIVDYGMGNLRSIQYKLEKYKIPSLVSSKPEDLEKADKLILPGVGHFAKGMENLDKFGLIPVLNKQVLENKIPIFGICLGIQLFTKYSEEGNCEGLGWIDAETVRFDFDSTNSRLRIPHIGWNLVDIKKESPYWTNYPQEKRFYFVHSFFIKCSDQDCIVGTTKYGCEFVSIIQKNNIFGTQFHPEKSHRDGFELIENFALHKETS